VAARIIVRIPRPSQFALALLARVVPFAALVVALMTFVVLAEALR